MRIESTYFGVSVISDFSKMKGEITIDTPSDVTILLEALIKMTRPTNFVAELEKIEIAFNIYITEIETHEEFQPKYLYHWQQLTGLKATLENLKAKSEENCLEWKHQLPYLKFIKGVWEPLQIWFATAKP